MGDLKLEDADRIDIRADERTDNLFLEFGESGMLLGAALMYHLLNDSR